MNYFLFFSITTALSVLLGIAFVIQSDNLSTSLKKYRPLKKFKSIIFFIVSFSIVSLFFTSIVGFLKYKSFERNAIENPVCLESKGKAPIQYIWHQKRKFIVYNKIAYEISPEYIPDYIYVEKQIKENLDSIKVYQYVYPKAFGFLNLGIEKYIFADKPNQFIQSGLCENAVNIAIKK